MKESITTTVIHNDGEEAELKFTHEDNVVTVSLDGEQLFSGDWTDNFFILFCKALGNWKRQED